MKLNGFLNNFLKIVAHELEAPHAKKPSHVRRAKVPGDGFEIARRAPVDLGRSTPASAASDREYVTGLYRELLGREPDAEGLKAHLNGLRTGMSRDEIRQVFLTSPEYRAKQAAPTPTPAAPTPTPTEPPKLTGEAQLRQLIASDIMTAGGRVATDADYNYWLPKLQSPCDSGFVTSGQMTGVEYYHRRMLGWQAGGSDMAISGPYAGSPDAHGPVPSATDVVGPIDAGTAAPTSPTSPSSPSGTPTTQQLRGLIAADIMTAGGRVATDADYNYWLPMLQSPCDSGFVTSGQMTGVEYYHRRMLGWQAGGSDAATMGPYAGGPDANGPVPSAVDVISQLPS